MQYAGVRPAAHPPAGQPRRLRHARPRARRGARRAMPSGSTSSSDCTAASWRCRPTTGVDGVARRLMKTNPRLRAGQGRLAGRATGPTRRRSTTAPSAGEILGDPAHKIINAQHLPRRRNAGALRRITAPAAGGGGRATTACRAGGRAATRSTNTTQRLEPVPDVRIAARRRTPATCCTTTSPNGWPRSSSLSSAEAEPSPGVRKCRAFPPPHRQDTPWTQNKSTRSAPPSQT